MKTRYYLFLFCLLWFVSCKKGNMPGGNGCISRISRHYINGADSLAAVNLLKQNNIPNNNLVYDRIILNDTVKDLSTGITSIYQHIFALQYFNGLPLFVSDLGFHFKAGVFQSSSGTRYNAISLTIIPVSTLPQIRNLFLNEAGREGVDVRIKDSCLVAEFGYYNLNAGTNNTSPNFVKAWYVTPKNSNYPEGAFQDGSGKLISFFNGIETLN